MPFSDYRVPGKKGRYSIPRSYLAAIEARAAPSVKKQDRKVRAAGGLTKYIKKVIASEQETKYLARDTLNEVSFNSAVTSTSELYTCVPAMGVGTNSSERIGQTVKPRSCHIRGTIGLTSDQLTADIMVYMYVFTSNKFKNYPTLVSNFSVNDMLDTGLSSTTNPTGFALVATYPPEKESIRLLNKKTFHLQKGYGFQNSGGATDTGAGGGAPTMRHFNIKIKCPATLKYDDSVAPSHATNFAPVVCFGYYHTDGTSPDVVNRAITINMRSELYYDDA